MEQTGHHDWLIASLWCPVSSRQVGYMSREQHSRQHKEIHQLLNHIYPRSGTHPQQRQTQTSGITPFASNKYQARGQNGATGRESPTPSVMATARERSAIERASLLAFSRSQFPAPSRGNPPQKWSHVTVTATPTLQLSSMQRDSPLRTQWAEPLTGHYRHTHWSAASDSQGPYAICIVP